MVIEILFDRLAQAPGPAFLAILQDAGGHSLRETGRQIASILGVLLLTGLWLHLAMHRNRRMASLIVLAIMGVASGAGYALGKEPRLELFRAGVSQLLLLLEVFIALTGGWREAVRTFVIVLVTAAAAGSAGALLATSFSNAGFAGELIVGLLIALFF